MWCNSETSADLFCIQKFPFLYTGDHNDIASKHSQKLKSEIVSMKCKENKVIRHVCPRISPQQSELGSTTILQ